MFQRQEAHHPNWLVCTTIDRGLWYTHGHSILQLRSIECLWYNVCNSLSYVIIIYCYMICSLLNFEKCLKMKNIKFV